MFEVFDYPIPEGFAPASRPTEEATRVPKDKILIKYCDENDMGEWAATCYDQFPEVFWSMLETKERPSLAKRTELMAKHFTAWLTQPGYHALKAVHADTGEMMGIAGWAENGVHAVYPTSYKSMPGVEFPSTFMPGVWRDDAWEENGIAARVGWTQADLDEMRQFHSDGYGKEFLSYDLGRVAELGDQPHWYLAPLITLKKWQARGVGRALLQWGIDRADAAGWPCVLESNPNARPVYYHLGFKPTEEHGPNRSSQLVRPAVKKHIVW